MNCRNCGAAMELFDRRRYFHCAHCGSFHFIESEDREGIRVLSPADGSSQCPLCSTPLVQALVDNVHRVAHCERCRGLLMARPTFGTLVNMRRANAAGPGEVPTPLDRRELERRITCPACAARMDVHPYHGPGNIVIDTCSACNLIWLDHGELKQISDAPGDDRGSRRDREERRESTSEPTIAARALDIWSLGEVFTLLDW